MSENVFSADLPDEYTEALNVNSNVPVSVGVPERVLPMSVKPEGKSPSIFSHTAESELMLVVNSCEYASYIFPDVRVDDVVIVNGESACEVPSSLGEPDESLPIP